MKPVVLASTSPRRQELLDQVGIQYEVVPSSVNEKTNKEDPDEIVMELASMKARDVAKIVGIAHKYREKEVIVVGADTIVADEDMVYGKPKDAADAKRMLENLCGDVHSVYTGVSLVIVKNGIIFNEMSFYKETKVYMRKYGRDVIDEYVASGEPMDKAGAYGIQGKGAVLVERIDGDFYNVVGLPVSEVYKRLRELGAC